MQFKNRKKNKRSKTPINPKNRKIPKNLKDCKNLRSHKIARMSRYNSMKKKSNYEFNCLILLMKIV